MKGNTYFSKKENSQSPEQDSRQQLIWFLEVPIFQLHIITKVLVHAGWFMIKSVQSFGQKPYQKWYNKAKRCMHQLKNLLGYQGVHELSGLWMGGLNPTLSDLALNPLVMNAPLQLATLPSCTSPHHFEAKIPCFFLSLHSQKRAHCF